MTWFYNSYSGELHNATSVLDKAAYVASTKVGGGWHELPLPSTDTQAQVTAWIHGNPALSGGATPTTNWTQGLQQEPAGVAAAATGTSFTSLTNAVEGISSALTSRNLWIRVAKVVIGGALLLVGVAKLTGADKQVATVGKVVSKVPLL